MLRNWEFLLGEIWGLIGLAALLGLFAGWLIWNRASELAALRSDLRTKTQDAEKTEEKLNALVIEHEQEKHLFESEKRGLVEERDMAHANFETQQIKMNKLDEAFKRVAHQSSSFEQQYKEEKSGREKLEAKLKVQSDEVVHLKSNLTRLEDRAALFSTAKLERDEALAARSKAQSEHADEIGRVRRRDTELAKLRTELFEAQSEAKRAAGLEAELAETKSKIANAKDLEAEIAKLRERDLARSRETEMLRSKANKIDQLENEAASLRSKADSADKLQRELSVATGQAASLTAYKAEVANRDEKIRELQNEIQKAKANQVRYANIEEELKIAKAASGGGADGPNLQLEVQRLRSEIQTRDATIQKLRSVPTLPGGGGYSGSSSAPVASHRDAGRGIPDYDGDGKFEGRHEGQKPTTLSEARGGKPDDLKRIKGVGPKLEGLLNELGFFHYDQIAAWTADEVAWVDANLEGFNGRVSRDMWIDQAKVLASGGQTDFASRVDDGEVYD